jgi:hypothetical protein
MSSSQQKTQRIEGKSGGWMVCTGEARNAEELADAPLPQRAWALTIQCLQQVEYLDGGKPRIVTVGP